MFGPWMHPLQPSCNQGCQYGILMPYLALLLKLWLFSPKFWRPRRIYIWLCCLQVFACVLSGDGFDFGVLVKLCLCLGVFFTYPVMLFPVTQILQSHFLPDAGKYMWKGVRVFSASMPCVVQTAFYLCNPPFPHSPFVALSCSICLLLDLSFVRCLECVCFFDFLIIGYIYIYLLKGENSAK